MDAKKKQELLELLKQAGSGYKRVEFDPSQLQYTAPKYKLTPNQTTLTPKDFTGNGKKDKTDLGINVFDMLAGIFAPIDNPIKNQIAYWTDGKWDSKDMPFSLDTITGGHGNALAGLATKGIFGGISGALDKIGMDDDNVIQKYLKSMSFNDKHNGSVDQLVSDALKVQGDKWNDDKFSWGDVPAVGFLHGLDKKSKTGEDILKNLGANSGFGRMAGGIGLDLLLSPSMYFTGGLSAAGKAGQVAKAAKLAEIARAEGLTGKFKNFDELGEAIIKSHTGTKTSLTNKILKYDKELNEVFTKAHNAHVNTLGLSVPNPVPFTKGFNKVGGKQNYLKLMDLNEGNLLFRGSPKMGSLANTALDNLFAEKGITKEQGEGLLKRLLGDIDPSTITKGTFDQIEEALSGFKKSNNGIKNYSKLEKVASSKLPELINTESTNMAKAIAKKNPFDLRTFKSSSSFVNTLANHLADATNNKIGGMAQYRKQLQGLEKMASELNPDEMKASIHILENELPKNWSWDGIDKDKATAYANEMGKVFKELAKNEKDMGLLEKTMEHYFPHIKNLTDKEIRSMMKHISKFNGRSQANKFNQEREGFRTLAERDNFISDAKDELANNANLTDKERSALEKTIGQAEKMFNENTSEVVLKRVGASLQSQAMKKMYNQFKKNGALVTKTKGSTKSTKGLVRVPKEVASKLGLGEGTHYMHPDVMKGLERVDELFTDEGMNRFMRTLGGVSSIFRTVTTTFLPSHYINNWLGNLFINEAAGVSIKEYNRSIKLLKKYHSGKDLNEAEQKIIDAAFKNNVINGGYNLDTDTFKTVTRGKDVGKTLTKVADKLEGFNEKILNTKVGQKMKHGGEFIDDTARLANFLNGLDKHNGNVKLATGQVRKYLFNYAENTNADRHMRAIVPFWNWIKRNVPLQINQVIENPKYFQTIEAVKDIFNGGREGEEWQKEGGIKIPFEDKYLRLPFPTSDLTMLENPVRGLLSSTQPLIKSPIELSTNKNLFTGNPITFGENQTSIPDALDYLFRSTTGIGSKAVSPFYDERNEDLSVVEKLQKMIASLFISTSDVNK